MAVYNAWTVEYLNGSTWTAISNVQDLSCQVGRQTAVDQWPVSQASMRIWYPEGYASPLANLTIGTYIRFFAPGRSSTKPSWIGLVRNVTLEVGIPWNSSASDGNGDFLVIDCEGAFANFGRINTTSITRVGSADMVNWLNNMVNGLSGYQSGLANANAQSNAQLFQYGDTGFGLKLNNLEGVQMASVLSGMRVCDGVPCLASWGGGVAEAGNPGVAWGTASWQSPTTTVAFSDTTNDATNRQYNEITFDGLADQLLNQSQLTYTNTTTSVTLTAASVASGYRTYVAQIPPQPTGTVLNTTQGALDWWANAFNPADIGISSISATTAGQHTQNLDTLGITDLELGYLPLYVVPVSLRGATYYVQIEGVSVTADTNQARFTYYVTPTDTTAWFTLDSSTYGVLDQNRLGIY